MPFHAIKNLGYTICQFRPCLVVTYLFDSCITSVLYLFSLNGLTRPGGERVISVSKDIEASKKLAEKQVC